MAITYELIYNLVRQEKKNEALQKIDPDIHEKIIEYLQTKLHAFKSAPEKQKPEIKTQINSARRLIKELYERRERKIVQSALIKSRADAAEEKTMLPFEQHMCRDVANILDRYRKDVLLSIINAKGSAKKSSSGMTLIRFTQPVPKFLDKDLNTLGPYEIGDIANLDSEIANVILNKKHAVKIIN